MAQRPTASRSGQTAAVSVSGGRAAAGVIDDFLKRHSRGELQVGTGYGSAFGLGWLHQRTRHRPVRLLIGDLRIGFDRWSEEDQKAALAFLAREDVSVRGCYAPDGMLHSKVWIALDPEGSDEPSSVLVGSANLTRNGLFKNDETVARSAPEEYRRIHGELARSMRRSWDAKAELMVRLGRDATDVGKLRTATRGWRPWTMGGLLPRVLAVLVMAAVTIGAGLLVLNQLQGALDDLADSPTTAPDGTAPPAAVSEPEAFVAEPEAPTTSVAADESPQPSITTPADVAAASPEPSENASAAASCPYALPDGSDACGLLESMGGSDSVPCDSLPLDARPLRLTSDANPAGYLPAHDASDLVCTWIDGGTFVAGETIPAGDLRAVNATVSGTGACRFEVYDEAGTVVASRADYERAGWVSYALLRLKPGATITTSGCGWVPAEHAGLGPGADGVIGAAQHEGRHYPLLVGVDVAPGNVRIECDYWAWTGAEPDESGSWADSLPRREDERRSPGPYRAESGVIWPKC